MPSAVVVMVHVTQQQEVLVLREVLHTCHTAQAEIDVILQ
jgi:hypothetical protein